MGGLTMSLSFMADASGAIQVMRDYVAPTMQALTAIAALASVFFIIYGGVLYMTSSGRPEKLDQAKNVLKGALIGLVIVLGAATLTTILNGSIANPEAPDNASLPSLQAIQPQDTGNGLIDVLINAITGLLNNIIQAVAAPFLSALNFFTQSTPLMTDNSSVFNFWLAMVGITDVLFVVVIALLGFHVMSAATFGFDEIEFKHLLPRIGLIFLLLNTSIFIIDGFIELSNALINAVGAIGGSSSVWDSLTAVVKASGGQGVAALLIMLVFLVFSVILLIYYIGRLVTLFIGAVLSPLVLLLWLVPSFKDFAETAMKTYLTTIFVLFVHVVILQLAASLFTGMDAVSGNDVPNTLMAMVVGLATLIALLKTQGVMMQFSFVSGGARNARKLGSTFMNGVSYLGGKGKAAVSTVSSKVSSRNSSASSSSSSGNSKKTPQSVSYSPPTRGTVKVTRTPAEKTGTTRPAPNVVPITSRQSAKAEVANKSQSKTTNKEDKAA